jgi:hypothetical protein
MRGRPDASFVRVAPAARLHATPPKKAASVAWLKRTERGTATSGTGHSVRSSSAMRK